MPGASEILASTTRYYCLLAVAFANNNNNNNKEEGAELGLFGRQSWPPTHSCSDG